MPPRIDLAGRPVSSEHPAYIIAEIGVNHNGDAGLAKEMVHAARDCGADAVKFQTFRTASLVRAGAPKAGYQAEQTGGGGQDDMLARLELCADDFETLRAECESLGIGFISTAFDVESLDLVAALRPVCMKWPSGEINNLPFLSAAASKGLPLLLSTGMATEAEIDQAMGTLRAGGLTDIVILQCVSNYPARVEDQNLRTIPAWADRYGVPTGFSDHTIGHDAAIAARALGMAVLEKHFTLDRTMDGPDHQASTEPEDFARMIRVLRQIETALGDGIKAPVAAEMDVMAVARKSLVFRQDLPAGHRLGEADFDAKRPNDGIAPDRIACFLGRTLTRPVTRGERLHEDHV